MPPPPPPQLTEWLRRAYPRPQVDPEWLDACYAWVVDDLGLDPSTQMDEIIRNVEEQLLQSNLEDSMLRGTGLPADVSELGDAAATRPLLRGGGGGAPVLVEIVAIMEVGHSAFTLHNTRLNRIEKADLTGLGAVDAGEGGGGGGGGDENEGGPIPNYPRSMLRFELTDGTVKVTAMEYRSIPEIQLGVTPLGYKMLLKQDIKFRRGIAYLEPKCIELKGFQTEDREVHQDADFLKALRIRMGKPAEDPAQPAPQGQPPAAADPPPISQDTNQDAQPSSSKSKYFDSAELPPGHSTLVNERFLSPPPSSGVVEADNDSFEVRQQLLLDNLDEDYGMEIDPEFLKEIELAEGSAMQDKPSGHNSSATASVSSTMSSTGKKTGASEAPKEIIAVDDDDDLYCSYDEADLFDDFEEMVASSSKRGPAADREVISISDSE